MKLRTDAEAEADPRVRAVFADIRASRESDVVDNFRRGLADDAALLDRSWAGFEAVMGAGEADPPTKELVYGAVPIADGFPYRIHRRTAARAKGLTPAQHGEDPRRGRRGQPDRRARQRDADPRRSRIPDRLNRISAPRTGLRPSAPRGRARRRRGRSAPDRATHR